MVCEECISAQNNLTTVAYISVATTTEINYYSMLVGCPKHINEIVNATKNIIHKLTKEDLRQISLKETEERNKEKHD